MVVEMALTTNEAMKRIDSLKPDVIVCDLNLESQNSLDYLRYLREGVCAVPFISFAYNDEKDVVFKSLELKALNLVPSICYQLSIVQV